jgi:hypothetical protein
LSLLIGGRSDENVHRPPFQPSSIVIHVLSNSHSSHLQLSFLPTPIVIPAISNRHSCTPLIVIPAPHPIVIPAQAGILLKMETYLFFELFISL